MAKYRSKRKYKRKFSRKRKKYSVKKTVKKVLRSMVEQKHIEVRFAANGVFPVVDTNNIVTDFDDGQYILPINLIRGGTGVFERVGKDVTLQSFYLNGIVSLDYKGIGSFEDVSGRTLRAMFIWDKYPKGALPLKSDIYASLPSNGTKESTLWSPISIINRKRFTKLKEVVFNFNPGANRYTDTSTKELTYVKRFGCYLKLNKKTTFSKTASIDITSIQEGALYLVFLTDKKVITTSADKAIYGQLSFEGVGTLRYSDL